jgi:hypothetical protein
VLSGLRQSWLEQRGLSFQGLDVGLQSECSVCVSTCHRPVNGQAIGDIYCPGVFQQFGLGQPYAAVERGCSFTRRTVPGSAPQVPNWHMVQGSPQGTSQCLRDPATLQISIASQIHVPMISHPKPGVLGYVSQCNATMQANSRQTVDCQDAFQPAMVPHSQQTNFSPTAPQPYLFSQREVSEREALERGIH